MPERDLGSARYIVSEGGRGEGVRRRTVGVELEDVDVTVCVCDNDV